MSHDPVIEEELDEYTLIRMTLKKGVKWEDKDFPTNSPSLCKYDNWSGKDDQWKNYEWKRPEDIA